MTVGFLGNVPPPIGGAEVFLRQFLAAFAGRGRHTATLVRWRKQTFRYFPEVVTRVYAPRGTVTRRRGLATHYLFEALPRRPRERRRAFEQRLIPHHARQGEAAGQIFRRAGVQLIHAHMLYPNVLLARLAAEHASAPFLATIHGMLELKILREVRATFPRMAALVEESLRKAAVVVAVSKEIARACRALGVRRVLTIAGGIDTAFFTPGPARRANGETVFVGTVRRSKGASLLIRAFERISGAMPGPLRFVGHRLIQGPAYERARRHRRIRFLGVQEPAQVRQALRRARLVVLPSESEGLPLSILEAMACGKPVLATNTGALSQVIRNGRNGFLIRRRTPVALGKQMLEIASRDDLRQVGMRARRTAEAFDIQGVIRRHETLYRSLIE